MANRWMISYEKVVNDGGLFQHGPKKLIQMIYIDNMKLKLNSSSVANVTHDDLTREGVSDVTVDHVT